jgi:hypothetical protein
MKSFDISMHIHAELRTGRGHGVGWGLRPQPGEQKLIEARGGAGVERVKAAMAGIGDGTGFLRLGPPCGPRIFSLGSVPCSSDYLSESLASGVISFLSDGVLLLLFSSRRSVLVLLREWYHSGR